MKRITQLLLVAVFLSATYQTCFALMMTQDMTRERAEKELGVVVKREHLGLGAATNAAGISIEFAPKDKLEGFLFVTLDIYLEWPTESGSGPVRFRRLTSATLLPVVQSKDKVRVFFSVDPEYLDRTEVTIRVRHADPASPDGYSIRLDPNDFPAPKANNAVEPTSAPAGARGSP